MRDDGVSYGDYLEQLTYLIFLKMADEYSQPPHSRVVGIPVEYNWPSLKAKRGAELEVHYVTLLRELGNKPGMLGQIFTKAQNKIQDPAKLYRVIDMVDDTSWVTMGVDVKGEIYEGLLERTPKTPSRARGSTSRPARSLKRWWNACGRIQARPLPTPPAAPAGFFSRLTIFWWPTIRSIERKKPFSSTKLFRATRSSPIPGACV